MKPLSTVLGGLAMLCFIVALPQGAMAQGPPAPTDSSYSHYCAATYDLFSADETLCNPSMFRDLYSEGITDLDIFEAWSCHGSRNRPDVSGCAVWSESSAGFIVVRGDEVTYRSAAGEHQKVGDNDYGLGNGIYYCCYTKRGQRALSPDPKNPFKRPPPPHIPGDGWDDLGEVPQPIVLP